MRSATGQLAGIAGALAQTLSLPSPLPQGSSPEHINKVKGKAEDGDGDLREKISEAKEAADRMVQSAKALETGTLPDTDAWEEMKRYAARAKEAAERAAKAIASATIQWKLTDEQRSEALCYRISYPSLGAIGDDGAKDL
ncbi:hypothetical protein NPX13_g7378 [Xylaria arbuscula]|uniref:Uncharacterized protein n=1 Tax=Xylaria arbuscula TaxID=114810 RepID=A0A9W8NAF8_9PEZI|nr:hypothetical protein NPX13_g7378 [Xylaria arbuscula]